MTVPEFVAAVTKGEVNFHETPIPVIPRAFADLLGQALEAILPPDETIHYAVEISRAELVGDDWRSNLEWLLLLDHTVLHLVGRLVRRDRPRLEVEHRLFPLTTLTRVTVTPVYEEVMGRVHLRAAGAEVTWPSGTLKANAELPERSAEAVLAFARLLLARRR